MPVPASNSRRAPGLLAVLLCCLAALASCGWQSVSRETLNRHSLAMSGGDAELREAFSSLAGVRLVEDADISVMVLDDNSSGGNWTLRADGSPGTRELVRRLTFRLQSRDGQTSPRYQTTARRLLPWDAANPQAGAAARRELEQEMTRELADGILYQLLHFRLAQN